jgi:hypothetical protein
MPGGFGVFAAIELNGGEARVETELRGSHLIGGDAVVRVLSWLGITIRAREPVCAARMPLVGVLVPKPLHDGKVRLVPSERLQALRQSVVGTGLFDVRKPGLGRDPPAKAEEDQTLGRCDRNRGRGKAPKAERFKRWQCDERGGRLKEMTTGFHGDYFV